MTSSTGSNKTIKIHLQDQTNLRSGDYTIYVVGFSAASKKMLSVTSGTTAAFVSVPTQPGSGTLPAYKLGTEITEIDVDVDPGSWTSAKEINGARIYFFVDDHNDFNHRPEMKYSNAGASVVGVPNPPTSEVPPYTFSEFTIKDLNYGAVIDVQTVDGFAVPLTVTLNDGAAVGQPLSLPGFSRYSILAAYLPFMGNLPEWSSASFFDLSYSDCGGGLLNPGLYLAKKDKQNNFLNLESGLNAYFDEELKALFSNKSLSIQGVGKGNIQPDIYTVVAAVPQQLPTPSPFTHQALQFKGKTQGNVFNVFSPLGLCALTFKDVEGVHPIRGQLNGTTLTFDRPLPKDTNIQQGMYVQGAGVDPNSTTVASIARGAQGAIIGVTINSGTGIPAPSQYGFSKVPVMFMTSGSMVFGNAGLFAYSDGYAGDESAIVLNLQNQLVCALNRGVANLLTDGTDGWSSKLWGTEAKWYPEHVRQNLFSMFMHTVQVPYGPNSGNLFTPIFIEPTNAQVCARGTTMGQAYGFAYDENPGPVPPAPDGQPPVPSKFDPVPAGTNAMTITLGAWK